MQITILKRTAALVISTMSLVGMSIAVNAQQQGQEEEQKTATKTTAAARASPNNNQYEEEKPATLGG
ncbi:MAG: hypothetical protein ACM37Z_20525 [Deltaproteobacteria bacterium]